MLEDYALLADGLLALYEATFEERWFTTARDLMEQCSPGSPTPPAASSTPRRRRGARARPKDLQDNAIPSGNAAAAGVLLRLPPTFVERQFNSISIIGSHFSNSSFRPGNR